MAASQWLGEIIRVEGSSDDGVRTDTSYVLVRSGDGVDLDFILGDYAVDEELGILSAIPGRVIIRTPRNLFQGTPNETITVETVSVRLDSHSKDGGFSLEILPVARPPSGESNRVLLSEIRPPREPRDHASRALFREKPQTPPGYGGPWGDVGVMAFLGPRGSVDSVQVIRSLSRAADSVAVASVRRWRFSGARSEGRRIASTQIVRVRFPQRVRY